MKKSYFRLSLVLVSVLVMFAGCRKNKEFDENMLLGTWSATDGYSYTFNSDHTGSSGDEDGSLPFTWDLDSDELALRFTGRGQAGKSAYLTFVIKDLSGNRMEAYDQNDPSRETIIFRR